MKIDKQHDSDHDLLIWRIKVGPWLKAIYEWGTRDFKDHLIEPPKVTAAGIQKAWEHSPLKMRPILWLEEADKFKPSEAKIVWLRELIDTVVELDGLIISTGNKTLSQLRELLTEEVYLRLSGEKRDRSRYIVWDLHLRPGSKR